jgi:NitT/TauT family transport system substrate-binding protein
LRSGIEGDSATLQCMMRPSHLNQWACMLGICLVVAGCGRQHAGSGLTPVTLQTDWYPQPEHGGFYDAQIRGYYKDEGLDVTILPGGPYVNSTQEVSVGTVQFAMGSSDNVLESIGNGVPFLAIMATMQHDPQAIMVHQDSPVHTFQDLDGHAVAIRLGASTWFEYLVKRYQLKNVREIPATYSVANFLQDPGYIQQIFVTSEPFFARQAGVPVRSMLISETGYNPYRVVVTSRSYLQQHPEIVAKFVRASLRGWRDYLKNPDAINAAISRLNPALSVSQMQFSYEALRDQHFISGDPSGNDMGRFDPARWASMYQQLLDLKVIKKPFDPATAYTLQIMPKGS